MKKKNRVWISPFVIMGLCLMLASSCNNPTSTEQESGETVTDIDGNVFIGKWKWIMVGGYGSEQCQMGFCDITIKKDGEYYEIYVHKTRNDSFLNECTLTEDGSLRSKIYSDGSGGTDIYKYDKENEELIHFFYDHGKHGNYWQERHHWKKTE